MIAGDQHASGVREGGQRRRDHDGGVDAGLDFRCLRPPAGLRWFSGCLDRAFDRAETILATVLEKARFWEAHSGDPLNERELKILNRLLDRFKGKLTEHELLAGPAGHQSGRAMSLCSVGG